MLKNFKSLFIKTDEEVPEKATSQTEKFSFPINNSANISTSPSASSEPVSDPATTEVLKVYHDGLESINMPGYDFYEFYQSVSIAGDTEPAYKMAFQMARTLDKTITTQKLMHDAEFYISKINEVHSQYISKGQTKLNSINDTKNAEKTKLSTEIEQASSRIAQLRKEMQQLEADITVKRNILAKIDENHYPQEKSIKEKLSANDFAHQTSINKLNNIKEGILKFLKDNS
ncbi:MAG TPA: hypothetical protein VF602_07560 [Pedobacter sp.]|jgi:hypothetical protein